MSSPFPATCACVDCDDVAAGQYLNLRQGAAIEFGVCTAHFARIEAGERPEIVSRQSQDGRDAAPALFLA